MQDLLVHMTAVLNSPGVNRGSDIPTRLRLFNSWTQVWLTAKQQGMSFFFYVV